MTERYTIYNGPNPTTAARAKTSTGTAIKTLLQAKLGTVSTRGLVVEWGISFDGSIAATPIVVELLTTSTVAATVTAHVAAGIESADPLAIAPTSGFPFTFSTTTTGYTASSEGTITATNTLDAQLVAPTGGYVKQWPLGREPKFSPLDYLRIRVHAAASVNALCYFVIEV